MGLMSGWGCGNPVVGRVVVLRVWLWLWPTWAGASGGCSARSELCSESIVWHEGRPPGSAQSRRGEAAGLGSGQRLSRRVVGDVGGPGQGAGLRRGAGGDGPRAGGGLQAPAAGPSTTTTGGLMRHPGRTSSSPRPGSL